MKTLGILVVLLALNACIKPNLTPQKSNSEWDEEEEMVAILEKDNKP